MPFSKMESPIECPLNFSVHYCTDVRGVSRSLFDWALMMPRDASISKVDLPYVVHPITNDTHALLSLTVLLFPGRKNWNLASFGIMGEELKAFLEPLNTIVISCTGIFRGGLNLGPTMPRDGSLSDSCTSNRRCFFPVWCCLSRVKLSDRFLTCVIMPMYHLYYHVFRLSSYNFDFRFYLGHSICLKYPL